MDRRHAIAQLEAHADDVRAMGATSLYLFDSTLRGEATVASDLDLFIEYDPNSRFNALDLVGIKLFLEERLHSKVDVTTREGLHPRLRQHIEQPALRVF